MKSLLIIILTLFILISCSYRTKYENRITRAENLIDDYPDSAIKVFDSIDASRLSHRLRMRYHLKRTLAQNRAYIPFTSDSIMKEVVEYYEDNGTMNEKMLANYLMGRVYSDMDNPMAALDFFHKAVEHADTTAEDCDFKNLSRIHGQIASLFGDQLIPEYELKEELLAVKYAWKAKDTLAALMFYEHLVGPYYRLNLKDSVISVSHNVSKMYKKHGYTDYISSCWPSAICVYLERKQYNEAKTFMDYFEQYSGLFNKNNEITTGYGIYYGFKGMYYDGINKLDSAEYFYRKLLSFPFKKHNYEISHKGLISVYQKRGVTDSVAKYANLYCEYNDSSYRRLISEKINRMQAIYDYSQKQKILERKTIESERYKMLLYVIALSIFTISYILYKMYDKRNKKKDKILQEAREEYTKRLQQYCKAKKEYALLQHSYDEYKKAKCEEITMLQKNLSQINDNHVNSDKRYSKREITEDKDIIKKLHTCSAKGKMPDNNDWKAFYEFTNLQYSEFIDFITEDKYELTAREVQICMLIRQNFQTSEIKNLLNISSQHITNIRGIINKKLFNAKGAKDLDKNIRMM